MSECLTQEQLDEITRLVERGRLVPSRLVKLLLAELVVWRARAFHPLENMATDLGLDASVNQCSACGHWYPASRGHSCTVNSSGLGRNA